MKTQLGQLLVRSLCCLVLAMGINVTAQAAADTAAKNADLVLRGDARCTKCHDEGDSPGVLTIGQTRHGVKGDARTPTCTSCHGESTAHVTNPQGLGTRPKIDRLFGKKDTSTSVEERNAACLNCHKGGKRTLWDGSQHQSHDIACVSCHTVHAPSDKVLSKATQREVCFTCHKTERAEIQRMSTHPIAAGKVACSDCHNPHGSDGPKLMAENTIRDTCFTCHAEKRGPFLWEHPSAMDDCMNCHTPHGSTTAPLLKARAPWLCQSCHADGAPHPGNLYSAALLPGGADAVVNRGGTGANSVTNPLTGSPMSANAPAAQLAFRACTNCHTQVHGSNHPSGQRFVR